METTSFFTTEITTGIFALGAIALGVQRLIKYWKSNSAETAVIDLMHTELDRVAKQNKILAEELNKLQLEIINLNKELRNLSIENNKLHEEIFNLSSELCRLQSLLNMHTKFKE